MALASCFGKFYKLLQFSTALTALQAVDSDFSAGSAKNLSTEGLWRRFFSSGLNFYSEVCRIVQNLVCDSCCFCSLSFGLKI